MCIPNPTKRIFEEEQNVVANLRLYSGWYSACCVFDVFEQLGL